MLGQMRRVYDRFCCTVVRLRTEGGATAVEYAVMVALIAAVIVVAVLVLGRTVSSTFSQTDECVRVRTTPTCPQ